ncbi:MAG: bifunctional diguanylate cyclase/phosphodiesterase [Actinomycetota bacterium]
MIVPLGAGVASTLAVAALVRQDALEAATPAQIAVISGLAATAVVLSAVALQRWLGAATLTHLRELESRATHDQLTGLPTRDEIRARLDRSLQERRRRDDQTAVLFLDVDGFKGINDSMGHEAGDEVLRAFAARLRAAVRSTDIVGRFGGDEFVVICPDLSASAIAGEIAENVLAAFDEPLETPDAEIQVVPSVGYAVAESDTDTSADELIGRADQAMYRAKREGGGIRVYDGAQQREAMDRLEVERAIVPALADGQFSVWYQPIVSQREGRTVGVEGLIRWMHPELGVLGPDRFLTIAEEAGLAARLGDVVLREVVAQTAIWNHLYQGPAFPSSINLSERQLVDPAFPDRVAELAEWCSIPTTQLDMEISEELLLRRVDDANRVIHRLAELGCRIVIDDFGNSQGAFSRIRSLPIVDVIKVDRSVVQAVPHDDVNKAVVEATMSMADALQLDVVAEGVETVAQKITLERLGIDLMQGFLFQRPMSAEALGDDGPQVQLEPSEERGAYGSSSSLSSRSSKLRALIDG